MVAEVGWGYCVKFLTGHVLDDVQRGDDPATRNKTS